MAEQDSSQEKTEEPTARKIEKSREEGQAPRSKELSTTMVLLLGALGLLVFGPFLSEKITNLSRYCFSFDRRTAFDPSTMAIHLDAAALEAAIGLTPWLAVVLLAAFVGPLGVGGWLFSSKAFMPKGDRINPLAGLKRMFSMNSLVELIKAWAKVLVVGSVAWFVLMFFFEDAMAIQHQQVRPAIDSAITIIIWSVIALCASTSLIAIADVPWQLYSHKKKLRMSMQDIKDEFKETEGKPEVKGRVRQLQREIAQRRMMADVPNADVIITNPTHYSIALSYSAGSQNAPVLVAKGVDQAAMKIREIAKEHNIPQMQAPPLARALYAHARVGDEIPEGLYVAVAQVLAYIFQMDQFVKGNGPRPERKPDFPIPRDLRVDPAP
ncbi:MAG: flagellar biosynthesis protein FlhB [Oleibacter sp.]|nr:flagellar biosynthesis protein FlhB [Thalassolituus sp.]